MSGILTSAEISGLGVDLDKVFSTFADRNIVVWKEPIRVPVSQQDAAGGAFGFGGADIQESQQYIPVSGIFPAVVRYASTRHVGQATNLSDTNVVVPVGEVKIKVRIDCYQFIESGQTDKISFDNRDWVFIGKAQACPFMGGQWWQYQLRPKI